MRRNYLIYAVFLAVLIVMASCSESGPRVIPRSKMLRIYEEMFITDQWIETHHKYRSQTDTMFVYEPIFRKYGYTTEDYFTSVDHYMEEPSSYVKILHEVSLRLNRKHDELEREMIRRRDEEDKMVAAGLKSGGRGPRMLDYRQKLSGRYRADTLSFTVDTLGRYILEPVRNRSWKHMYDE